MFRAVALVVSAVATVLFLLCVAAVVLHSGREHSFGWRSGLDDGTFGRRPRDAEYTLTMRRAGIEQTVTLRTPPLANVASRAVERLQPNHRLCLARRDHDDRAVQAC
jgi:hypothetical protein